MVRSIARDRLTPRLFFICDKNLCYPVDATYEFYDVGQKLGILDVCAMENDEFTNPCAADMVKDMALETESGRSSVALRVYPPESLATTTLLTKRHANTGCERSHPIRALYNRDTQWGGRDKQTYTKQNPRCAYSANASRGETGHEEGWAPPSPLHPSRGRKTTRIPARYPRDTRTRGVSTGYANGRHSRIKPAVPCGEWVRQTCVGNWNESGRRI